MFACKYCGKFTLSFSSSHKQCREIHHQGLTTLQNILKPENLLSENIDANQIAQNVNTICSTSFISESDKNKIVSEGLLNALTYSIDDHILSENEEKNLIGLFNVFASNPDLQKFYFLFKEYLQKADILQKLRAGKIGEIPLISESLPFLLQKNERIIFASKNVDYFETKVKTTYKGSSQGVSIRIAKGVYYRVGAFRGHPVKTEHQEYVGTGTLALSDKNIYFHSPTKSVKIPYSKIVTLESYENGITIMRDGAAARPQTFKGIDGWYYSNAINLITNL
ncbi:hypothetical protein JCM31826_09040 [Thermaurantimonas aggregans]|uniref:Uncharacterized protein n=2 Tax=Thermaurantimonas aggregans TaxID=2173829 RepID=A0A401XK94_9FLAO|nr:hypothetical protein JCM31826_09040 [Thermaurantimonas aggregans]